jgi:NAD-dependent dihydropyrimidine dehydrogenase PreA subunit
MYIHAREKENLMPQLAEHPTVKQFYEKYGGHTVPQESFVLDASWLRQLCLDAGAEDVGFVEAERPEAADQKTDIEFVFPRTKTLISFVCRIVVALQIVGVGAVNGGAAGFPMEADRWGSKMWVISHKPVAVAAGLGRMGIHRNVIHPKFGNFILLGTVLVDARVSKYSYPIAYNPCLECKLCVAVCPTGAISPSGEFNFSA